MNWWLDPQIKTDRLGLQKFEGSVTLKEASNTIQVRLIFGDITQRFTSSEWTVWSFPVEVQGPALVQVRHDRLKEYMNPKNIRAKEQEDHSTTLKALKDIMHSTKEAAGVGMLHRGEAAHASVAKVIAQAESKILLKVNKPTGPPNEVKQRFVTTGMSPFALAREGNEDVAKRLALNLGENVLYHDPLRTGPEEAFCILHAYIKRILVTAKIPNTVMLYSVKGNTNSRQDTPKGFVDSDAGTEATMLEIDRQYIAQVTNSEAFGVRRS